MARKQSNNAKRPPDQLADAALRAGLTADEHVSLRRWLAELFVSDEFAKLGQGGHTNSEIPLRRVFVDLPVASQSRGGRRAPFLEQLLNSPPISLRSVWSTDDFDAENSTSPEKDGDGAAVARARFRRARGREFSRTLLIGGPGQGKSTLGQLACQLHRAALLAPSASQGTSREREVLAQFGSAQGRLKVAADAHLPVHISLPELAAWIAKRGQVDRGSGTSLLAFLSSRASAKSAKLVGATLLRIAPALPILLVLDGFDEVGAASDREAVVASIRECLAALAEADVLAQVLATTRPQGYGGELGRVGLVLYPQHLMPLEEQEALEYARKLVEAKIPGVEKQNTAIARLTEAARRPETARLLTTPLQVTIITALVQQGRAPKERWRLFLSYFDYTYRREIERETYASPLLAEHRTHIEAIHGRVGLLLQVEAERAGGATARMSSDDLRDVVETVLREDGIENPVLSDLAEDILKAAGERLVFLVEPEPGSFGFEIRSLQEFMAAWALTSGPDGHVRSRLAEIARASMFRNVLLFAASRLYSESSHLRDELPAVLCGAAEMQGVRAWDVGLASSLALEIMEEGAVLNQPRQATALLQKAVRAIELPPSHLHVRLARVAAAEWGGALLKNAIEDCLVRIASAGEANVNALGAWACLNESINCGREWAVSLAEQYWVAGPRPIDILKSCDAAESPTSEWLSAKFEEHAASVSFMELYDHLAHSEDSARGAAHTWTAWLRRMVATPGITADVGPYYALRSRGLPIEPQAEPRYPAPAAWSAIVTVARYCAVPSAANAAAALDSIVEQTEPDEWLRIAEYSYWPLAACLRIAENAQQLRAFGRRFANGSLGDLAEWDREEASWDAANGRKGRLVGPSSFEDVPWSRQSLKVGPPVASLPRWSFQYWTALTSAEVVATSARCFLGAANQRMRGYLARACLAGIRTEAPPAVRIDVDVLSEWIEAASDGLSCLVPRPRWMGMELWLATLDRFKKVDPGLSMIPTIGLFEALSESKGHVVVARLIVRAIAFRSDARIEALSSDVSARLRIANVLEAMPADDEDAMAYVAILRVFIGALGAATDSSIIEALRLGTPESFRWRALLEAINRGRSARGRAMSLLRLLADVLGLTDPLYGDLVRVTQKVMQAEASPLHASAVWARLGLPSPSPKSSEFDVVHALVPAAPVVLSAIDLRDVRGIPALQLRPVAPSDERGQWTVILGPNGAGKTTVLRAIALVCRNAQDPSIWPDNAFALPWMRAGTDEARLQVRFGDGTAYETKVLSAATLSIVQSPEHLRARPFPLFAYGCRRGSALGGTARVVDLKDDGGPEVATLFSEGRDLVHAETWLLILDGSASHDLRMRVVFDSVVVALTQLLDVRSIDVGERRVWVTENDGRRVPLEAMSDGYLTMAGWFLDLVARWVEMLSRHGLDVPVDFLSHARGLVLIDEIDLHLHPRWQVEVIGRVRALLPQMSFVVTTHNPLTLVGARPEEIWILSRDGDRLGARQGVEMPMLLTGGQVFHQYFGIQDLYPSDVGRKLQRYGFLSGFAGRSDAEEVEVRELALELAASRLLPDWPVVVRKRPRSRKAAGHGKLASKANAVDR